MTYAQPTFKFVIAACVAVGMLSVLPSASASSVGLMPIETLAQMLGNPDLVILDVRTGRDWTSSAKKIKGAKRAAPGDFATWSGQYAKDKKIVLYCA